MPERPVRDAPARSVPGVAREKRMGLLATIAVELKLEAGRVRGVAMSPASARSAAAGFIGLESKDVPGRAALLYALCPMSQRLAAEAALAAAGGEVLQPERDRIVALLAEHYRENLRSLVLVWPDLAPDGETLSLLRTALAAARDTGGLALAELRARIELMRRCAEALGIGTPSRAPATRFGRLSSGEDAANGASLFIEEPASDDAVFRALAAGGATPVNRAPAAMRVVDLLNARSGAIGATLQQLIDLVETGRAPPLCAASCLGVGVGAAAVVSPRGRLFHAARIDDAGRVLSYRTLSPTDRNFADGGPLARSLLGLDVGSGAAAERRVARMAALYDPCVAVHVKVREAAHA